MENFAQISRQFGARNDGSIGPCRVTASGSETNRGSLGNLRKVFRQIRGAMPRMIGAHRRAVENGGNIKRR